MSNLNKLLSSGFLKPNCTLSSKVFNRTYKIKLKKNKLKDFYSSESGQKTYSLYTWGLAELGALGEPKIRSNKTKLTIVHAPVRKTLAFTHRVTDFSCGYGFTLYAVESDTNKKVFGSGLNSDSQLGYHAVRRNHPLGILYNTNPIKLPINSPKTTNVLKVAAGRAHSIILTDKEGVFSIGNNAFGQCGRPVIEDENYLAFRELYRIKELNDSELCFVECGQDHSLFLTKTGQLYSCGCGSDGQTGLGHMKSVSKPTLVEGDIKGENIIKVTSKGDTVLALNDKGEVFGWGNNEYFQLPIPEEVQQISTPIYLKHLGKLGKVKDISAGGTFCMILTEDNEVYVWGYGILGKGPDLVHTRIPEQIPITLFGRNQFYPDVTVKSVYCGINSLAAINSKGDLFTWGKNNQGQLGIGHKNNQFFPFRVSIGAKVLKVDLGADHTLALCKPYV